MEKAMEGLRALVALDLVTAQRTPRRMDGYVSEDTKYNLVELTDAQAEMALNLGVPIGLCDEYDIYHGSHKGEYGYGSISSMESLRRSRGHRTFPASASIHPYRTQDARQLRQYIDKALEIEALQAQDAQPEQQAGAEPNEGQAFGMKME